MPSQDSIARSSSVVMLTFVLWARAVEGKIAAASRIAAARNGRAEDRRFIDASYLLAPERGHRVHLRRAAGRESGREKRHSGQEQGDGHEGQRIPRRHPKQKTGEKARKGQRNEEPHADARQRQ